MRVAEILLFADQFIYIESVFGDVDAHDNFRVNKKLSCTLRDCPSDILEWRYSREE
jgi:hypothetical protein